MKNNNQEIKELLKNGQDQFKQNKFYDAINLYEDALEMCKKDEGELSEHPMAAEVLNKLGRVHISVANYKKAEECLGQALSSLKQNHENIDALFLAGEIYNNLAALYIHIAQYTKAEEYLEISKSIFRNASQASDNEEGDSSSDSNSSSDDASSGDEDDNDSDDDENNDEFDDATKDYYHNLIELNCALLKQDLFEEGYQLAKEIGDNNSKMASNNTVAAAYNSIGKANKANYIINKIAKAIDKEQDKCNQVEIAKYYVNLANLRVDKGKYSKDILETYVDALKIQQEIYGKQVNHPDIAKTYCGLGDIYLLIDSEDNKGVASQFFTLALEMQKEVYQSDAHPDMIQVHYGLGRMFSAQKNYKEAANYFEKAIVIENQIFDENYISAKGVIIKIALAEVYFEDNKFQEAKDICEKEIDLLQTLNPWQDSSYKFFIDMSSEMIKKIDVALEKIEIEQGLTDLLAELNLDGEGNAEGLLPDAQGESSQVEIEDQGSQLTIIGSHGGSAEIL